MPTPYGSRGGMAFSADELRVLRRALAIALQPTHDPAARGPLGPDRSEEVRDCLRLAEDVDEAVREGGRQRAFLLADLARYRAALPGSAGGYLDRLQEALATGYVPGHGDLAALRSLCARRAGPEEAGRRAAVLHRCEHLAERSVRARLRALPGGRAADGPAPSPPAGPDPRPRPAGPRPDRPIPTPGEVFPPRRKPAPPPKSSLKGRFQVPPEARSA
ncbi:hypothetical protein [Streptomyces sp. MST-110588]|uniref:hypothetical protein n=1 Tax=Streptomyces sp. MST-110588 TaxID=2833628 RepID=UPI001F5C2CFE|nr:hypothetical protein [Streptomyces sp. MST-110588]UNO40598.1 hypothetical protein KGS77_14725 [Streptomyces sp. MST-110588]